jgi:amino acid adenylation domain-containing protein
VFEVDSDLLHDWLRRTAEATPLAAAIVDGDRVTTFRELFEAAASLARRFVEHGVQPQDRIALVLHKNTDAVISIFASLLAGATYVPIHPLWPRERMDAVLEDCSARLVIEGESSPPQIRDRQTGASIPWRPTAGPAVPASLEVLPRVSAADPALILFTSGSTGVPKGVVLSHRAVSAFVRWTAEEFHITSQDRLASPSPLGFDLSTFDLFNTALCGATCVLVPGHIVWLPRLLAKFVHKERISCWYSVPSIMAGMLHEGRFAEHQYPALRLVLFAGEVFAGHGVAQLQAAVPHAVCANLYGPTETNVVTWTRVPPGYDGSEPLPIGHATPYAHVTVDAASGELLAGGASLMTGYWNRPEDTARCFETLDGVKYYRTGDRVSLAADGSYCFIGRLDRQVKRRGFRMELGEIEAALLRHEDILEAALVATENSHQETVLTAFVRVRSTAALNAATVKAHCAHILPPYMAPDRIVFQNLISKGSRGKVDYIALRKHAEELHHGEKH